MILPIRCFGDRVLLSFPEKNKITASGIVVPDQSRDPDQMWICEVSAVGPGFRVDDGYAPLDFRPGDKVMIDRKMNVGEVVDYDGWSYLWTQASNILGIVEEG